MGLTVYKASAGSGKTFTLAVEYIRRMVLDPTAYRHILAVTFTNKATTEMKDRILQELWGIGNSSATSESYLSAVREKLAEGGCGMDDAAIRRRCSEALHNILHDYSRFRISTIDSFFQTVTRNVARELGIGSDMNIELNTARAVNEAVDHILESLDRNPDALGWITDFIDSRLDNDKSRHVERSLKDFGRNIFDEEYMEHGSVLRRQIGTKDFMRQYIASLNAARQNALDSLKPYYDRLHRTLADNGVDLSELSNKGRHIETYFAKLRSGYGIDTPGTTIDGISTDAERWVNKTSKRHDEIAALAAAELVPLAAEAEAARSNALHVVNSADMTSRYLYQLQLLNVIAGQVDADNRRQNRFLLPETNRLLSGLLADDDSSFIYEKIGASITNIMIDEFQDTSRMQWANLRPLLREGLAQGADSLIVGDVKQSIYRWRGGDWSILNGMREQQSPFGISICNLDTNWRSETNIVSFNNAVFANAARYFNDKERADRDRDCEELTKAYSDVVQHSRKEQAAGMVKVRFIDTDGYKANMLEALGHEVQELMASGIPMKSIALLLRKKSGNLPLIAEYFENVLHLPVVSDEAFRLDASTAVNIMMNALRVIVNRDDHVSLAALAADYMSLGGDGGDGNSTQLFGTEAVAQLPATFTEHTESLGLMPLYELAERLYSIFGLDRCHEQDAYLLKFFDEVSKFLDSNASDLSTFLGYWDSDMCDATIPGGDIDGIRILTIHKSKGLEYHTVIVPFCDWSQTTVRTDELMWCSTGEQPFAALDMVPLAYSSKMMPESAYSDDFYRERMRLWVDNLNMLYVAFTRAGKNLIVLARSGEAMKQRDKTSRGSRVCIGDMLFGVLPDVARETGAEWDNERQEFLLGTLVTAHTQGRRDGKSAENPLEAQAEERTVEMNSSEPDVTFRESNRSAAFIASASGQESSHRFMDRGNIMHRLFAAIRTADDIDRAIDALIAEGIVAAGDSLAEDIRQETHRAFADERVQGWFDGSWTQLFNERNIIQMADGRLKQQRPDRVMMRGDDVVVIDYKFGKPSKRHFTQVHDYMELLSRMGYADKNITGYLWYVDSMEIEQVE